MTPGPKQEQWRGFIVKDFVSLRTNSTFLMGGRCLCFPAAHLVSAQSPAFQAFMDTQLTFTAERRCCFFGHIPEKNLCSKFHVSMACFYIVSLHPPNYTLVFLFGFMTD